MPSRSIPALLAAVLLTAGTASAADIPADKSTKAVLKVGQRLKGSFEAKGDSDWYKLSLKAGQNYALSALLTADNNCVTAKLRDAKGKVLGSASSNTGKDDGFEFQPAKAGSYFVEFQDGAGCRPDVPFPLDYRGEVRADARGDSSTKATLKLGQTVKGTFNYSTDHDLFRAELKPGVIYTVSGSSKNVDVWVVVLDKAGNVLASELASDPVSVTFQVPSAGSYFVGMYGADDTGGAYELRLAKP